MGAFSQISIHSKCLCKQCLRGHWGKINFHLRGILRAVKQLNF